MALLRRKLVLAVLVAFILTLLVILVLALLILLVAILVVVLVLILIVILSVSIVHKNTSLTETVSVNIKEIYIWKNFLKK